MKVKQSAATMDSSIPRGNKMRLRNDTDTICINTDRLCLTLASTPEAVREVQRLRYKIFVESGVFSACSNEKMAWTQTNSMPFATI